ncbi:hypothetical protein ACFVFS_39525 [Kitasatospora sp. NPDC057692]|uniref:hypothetical protein n=1 Tax=Kitasatospora sp. NPDC057692 TaxID=3346215 RepID=UPI0036B6C328
MEKTDRPLVADLLGLGQEPRDAQAQLVGDRLGALGERRRQLVRELLSQARRDAEDAGHPLGTKASEEVERTVGAALADCAGRPYPWEGGRTFSAGWGSHEALDVVRSSPTSSWRCPPTSPGTAPAAGATPCARTVCAPVSAPATSP